MLHRSKGKGQSSDSRQCDNELHYQQKQQQEQQVYINGNSTSKSALGRREWVPRPLKLSHIRDLPDNVAKHVKPLVPVPPIYRYEEVDAYSSCKIRSAGEESRSRKSNTRPVVSSYHRSASSPIPQSYSNSNYTEFMASGISTQRNTGGRRRKRGGRGRNRRGRRRGSSGQRRNEQGKLAASTLKSSCDSGITSGMKTSNGSIGNASFGVGGANTHSTKTNLQAPFPPKGSLSLTPTVEARRTTISTSESPNQDEVESIIPAIAKLFEQNNAVNSITKQKQSDLDPHHFDEQIRICVANPARFVASWQMLTILFGEPSLYDYVREQHWSRNYLDPFRIPEEYDKADDKAD